MANTPPAKSAVLLVLFVLLTACGNDDGTTATTTTLPETTTTVPEATTTTAVPETTTTTADDARETIFGWLRSFEGTNGTTTVKVDEAQMLTGDEAIAAAREDGEIGPDEVLPNDYYIRNPDESTIDLTVSPAVVVTLQACYEDGECVTTEQVDLDTWSVLLGSEDDPGLEWNWYGGGALPYHFTVDNGVIVEIEEQYLP